MCKKLVRLSVIIFLLLPLGLQAQQLKILDWNIHSFEPLNSGSPVDDIKDYVALISNENPDVVTLNEFETGTNRMKNREMAAEIASRLGMFMYFIESYPKDSEGYYGNVILSRYPILNTGSVLLSYKHYKGEGNYQWNSSEYTEVWGADQRSAGYADILVPVSDTESKTIRIVCAHLDHQIGIDGKRKQFEELIACALLDDCPYPAILAGDMNISGGSAVDETVLKYGDKVYLNWVDWIISYPQGGWTVKDSGYMGGGYLSDHEAIWAVVELN